MLRFSFRPLLYLALTVAFGSQATAQGRLLVPSQYAQIGAAVQAAAPGSTIEVQWQAQPYQPFVVDRELTIVGFAVGNQAPIVRVPTGAVGIDFQLAAGEHATISRLDVVPAPGAVLATGVNIQGGNVSLEDCRIASATDLNGNLGLAALTATDAELRLAFCRLQGGGGCYGLNAVRTHIAATSSRLFGGSMPAADGCRLDDSIGHFSDCLLLGGEDFLGGPGMSALRAHGSSRAYCVDCTLAGGMGQTGGAGLVNVTAVPVELLRSPPAGGLDLTLMAPAASALGPTAGNGNLLGLTWSEPLYRRGTLQPGQPWAVYVSGQPNALVLLAMSLAPTQTAPTLTRQPALLPQDLSLAIPVTLDAAGHGGFGSTLPNVASLRGLGLWAQAVSGTSFPLEVSPLSGVVVR